MTMTRTASIGVVLCGTGDIAATHARAVRACSGLRLQGVFGHDRARTAAVARALGTEAVADLEHALARPDVGALVVASATDRHLDQVRLAVEHGKHALVEKPFALDVDAAARVAADARARGLVLAGVFQRRFLPVVEDVREQFARGELGRAVGASAALAWRREAQYFEASPWRKDAARAGGGVVMMQAIHTLDLLRFVLGEVDDVRAQLAPSSIDARIEAAAALTLGFRCGALAALFATTAARRRVPQRVALHFERGSIELVGDALALDTRQGASRGARGRLNRWRDRWLGPRAPARESSFARVHADFERAIREGLPPRCGADDALASVALVQRCYAAAAGGR